jgi:hypothetical protein
MQGSVEGWTQLVTGLFANSAVTVVQGHSICMTSVCRVVGCGCWLTCGAILLQ